MAAGRGARVWVEFESKALQQPQVDGRDELELCRSLRRMRSLHRWIAPLAVLFLTIVAATGVYMQGETLWRRYYPPRRVEARPLPSEEIPKWIAAAIDAVRRAHPQCAIAAVSISRDGDRPRADVECSQADIPPLSLDALTGRQFLSSKTDVENRSQYLGRLILQLHRGDLLGLPGRWLGLACGIGLLTLGLTGLIMYLNVYRQRFKLGRWSPFW
jgi:uncharacterized iron-regulated membrane protein